MPVGHDLDTGVELLAPAGEHHVRSLAELWAEAFPRGKSVREREREIREGNGYGGLESCWVAERGGRVIAALRTYAFQMSMHGSVLPVMGLAGVAVAPDQRRRGVGRRICVEALRIAHARGDALSVLYPARASFYQPLGYALAGELHRYRFPPVALPQYEERSCVRAALRVDRAALAELHRRAAMSVNGMLLRTPRLWAFLDEPRWQAFVYDPGGRPSGYVVVGSRTQTASSRPILQVKELIADDEAAYRGLLGWLAAQADRYQSIVYDALPEERLSERMADPRTHGRRPTRGLWFETARILRGPMLRIVDVELAFGLVASPVLETFAVLDPQIPANERVWEVGGRGLAEAGRGAATAPEPWRDSQTVPLALSMAGLATRYLRWRPNARLLGPP
ncbi:MAG: GNAT family N-acetyltransferase, partial [Gemmatimonadetes bacterium]|nr:GNAT family N-acetyltransferase [Gemmatimonadota bacterium]